MRTASINEYSTRYSIAIDATQTTPPDEWRTQAKDNRQGSEEPLAADVGRVLSEEERKLQEETRRVYQQRLDITQQVIDRLNRGLAPKNIGQGFVPPRR